jgi:hypothetical protein
MSWYRSSCATCRRHRRRCCGIRWRLPRPAAQTYLMREAIRAHERSSTEFDGDCPVLQLKLTFSGRPTEAPAVRVEHLRIRIRGACAKGLTTGGAAVSTCMQAKAIKSGANAKGLTCSRARAREGGHQGSSVLIRAHQCSPHLKAQAGEGGLLLGWSSVVISGHQGFIRRGRASPHLKAQAGEGGLLLDVELLPLLELGTEPVLTCGERRRSEHLHAGHLELRQSHRSG